MPLVRIIISSRQSATEEGKDAFVNTLYFNVSGSVDDPDYEGLVNDLWTTWSIRAWAVGRYLDMRAYSMDDPEPRVVRFRRVGQVAGQMVDGVPQVALALSYFADRNLPRHRGRIFLGPWSTGTYRPSTGQVNQVVGLAQALADLGGVNVDWSLWSPTTQTHTRITDAWCDDSWDIIRSRKIARSMRVTWSGDG